MSHLDELFEKNFQEKLRVIEQEWSEFQSSNMRWTKHKIYEEMLIRLRKERDGMIESKWKNIGDSDLSFHLFEYKKSLFDWFQNRHIVYREETVHNFMQEDYPKLKKNFESKFLVVPKFNEGINLQLSEFFSIKEGEIVEQMAHYEAILEFIKKLESADKKDGKEVPSFADKVRDLFAASQYDEAFELFINHLKNTSSPLLDEVIIVKSRYTEVRKKSRMTLIEYLEESNILAQITSSALAILRDFEGENP